MDVYESSKVSVIFEETEPSESHEGRTVVSTVVNAEENELPSNEVNEFFEAVHSGSISRLEELFRTKPNADPNMTHFTESLLMAAIRSERNEMAEYLIDQLAINVEYTADMHEFRVHTKTPLRFRKYSCRDLAYRKGMMTLVDLIDLASEDVRPATKQLIRRRLQSRIDTIHQNYLQRMKQKQRIQPAFLPPLLFSGGKNSKQPNSFSTHRSHIDELLNNLRTNEEKSIDETGDKKFRFSNYTVRFRVIDETKTINRSVSRESNRSKPTIPHSNASLTSVSLPSFTTPVTTHPRPTVSQHAPRLPVRDTRTSIGRLSQVKFNSATLPKFHEHDASESQKSVLEKHQRDKYNLRNDSHQTPSMNFLNGYRRPVLVTLKPTGIGLSIHPEEIKN